MLLNIKKYLQSTIMLISSFCMFLVNCSQNSNISTSKILQIIGTDDRIENNSDWTSGKLLKVYINDVPTCNAFSFAQTRVATAAHCFFTKTPGQEMNVSIRSIDNSYKVKTFYTNEKSDIALIEVDSALKSWYDVSPYISMSTSISIPHFDFTINKSFIGMGNIKSKEGNLFNYEIDTVRGSSGAPIIQGNKVIGIHLGARANNTDNVGVWIIADDFGTTNSEYFPESWQDWVKGTLIGVGVVTGVVVGALVGAPIVIAAGAIAGGVAGNAAGQEIINTVNTITDASEALMTTGCSAAVEVGLAWVKISNRNMQSLSPWITRNLRPYYGDLVDKATISYNALLGGEYSVNGKQFKLGATAQTFGNLIFDKSPDVETLTEPDKGMALATIAHEMRHVQQFSGVNLFQNEYCKRWVEAGYDYNKNAWEVDAYDTERIIANNYFNKIIPNDSTYTRYPISSLKAAMGEYYNRIPTYDEVLDYFDRFSSVEEFKIYTRTLSVLPAMNLLLL